MINFKKIGFLEILVLFSAFYVLTTLIWTASTRSSVQEKANLIKSNHQLIVNFINKEINNCDRGNDQTKTIWGDLCIDNWSSKNNQLYKFKSKSQNPHSNSKNIVKSAHGPKITRGKAGQSTEMGTIFVSNKDFQSAPGSEWIIGICVKSPCVAV